MVKQDPHEIDKWWKRKVASAMAGGSNVMPFVTVMLGTLFEAEGATVHYAAEFDNDPTLAAYANIDNAVRPRVFILFATAALGCTRMDKLKPAMSVC